LRALGGRTVGARALELLSPQVYCHVDILRGALAKRARYDRVAVHRRAAASSSHDDSHPGNSTLYTGAVRPHTGFVESLFFISPRAGHGSAQVFEMLSAFSFFSCISCACAFRAGDDASIFFSEPV
jgi:hypothetical protein